MSEELESKVAAHYGRKGLLEGILDGLKSLGRDPEHLSPEDLSAVDEFHIGGRAATQHLASLMEFRPDQHVLDVGCGIGGAARFVASAFGCSVTGIDLTPEYIAVAKELTRRTGLEAKVGHEIASALAMPFADRTFDAAITLHVAMNIADRDGLYREVRRVLKSGAAFGVYDVMKGPAPGLSFPVPWAESEQTSHVLSPKETDDCLQRAGFEVLRSIDRTEFGIAFFRERLAALAAGPSPIGLHLVMGANAKAKLENVLSNLVEGRIAPVVMVARRM